MSKLDEVKNRMFAVKILKVFKKNYTYEKLSRLIGLPPSVISRYINGHSLPNSKKTRKIINLFKEGFLSEMIKARIGEYIDGAYNLAPLNFDIELEELVAKAIFDETKMIKIDKIFTAAADGIAVGTQVANEFGVNLIVAKKEKEVGIREFLEEKAEFSPVLFKYFYIPKNSIERDENVLIVDDIIRTGATLEALVRLVEKSKAKVVGIFSICEIENITEKVKKRLQLNFEPKSFLRLKK